MGKKSDPPPAPDPYDVAAAQTGTSMSTAIANNAMGMVNQQTPDGSLTYEVTGSHQFRDPTTGQSYTVPTYTAVTELSDEQQAIRDQTNLADLNLATLGAEQSARVGDLLSEPFSLDGLPAAADRSGMGVPDYGAGPSAPEYATGGTALPSYQMRGPLPTASERTALPTGGSAMVHQPGDPAGMPQSPGPAPGLPGMTSGPAAPELSGAVGLPNVRDAGALPELASGTQLPEVAAGADLPGMSAGAAVPEFARTPETAGLSTGYETDFSQARTEVIDALFGQIDEQRGRDREALETRLANQGIRIGTEAYSRAMEDFQSSVDEARLNAILAGGDEHSRLTHLARDEAAFGNDALQTEFANQTGAVRYGNEMDLTRFGLEEDRSRYTDDFNIASYDRGEGARRFDTDVDLSLYDRGEGARRFDTDVDLSLYDRGEGARRFDTDVDLARHGLREDARRYGDSMALSLYDRGEDRSRYTDDFNLAGYDRSEDTRRHDQRFAEDRRRYDQGFSEDTRRYNEGYDLDVYDRGEDARRYGDSFDLAVYDRGEAGRQVDNDLLSSLYGMGEEQRRYGDSLEAQRFSDELALTAREDEIAGAQWQREQYLADAQDAARARALEETYAARNQPINEITALLSGSQVATPKFQTYTPTGMPTTDVAGIFQQDYANRLSQYQMEQQQHQALMGGLFGLGSSFLLGGGLGGRA